MGLTLLSQEVGALLPGVTSHWPRLSPVVHGVSDTGRGSLRFVRILRQYDESTLTQVPRILSMPDLSRGCRKTTQKVWFLWSVENPKWK